MMTNPLKESITQRLAKERRALPSKKERPRQLTIRFLLILSVLLGFIATLFRLISLLLT
nr:hypothetical protein [Streptococcus gallolyticus]